MKRVAITYTEELDLLDNISREFRLPYRSEPIAQRVYYDKLERFILDGLIMNLTNRLSNNIAMMMLNKQKVTSMHTI